uniref:Protein tyrosine phosphatase n=1 Tax=Panagrolaimus sp. JU765 TaxID=591449 RepID=A0AC34QW05_9BILA
MDAVSNISSVEPQDAIIDETCFTTNKRYHRIGKTVVLMNEEEKPSVITKASNYFSNRAFQKALDNFDHAEEKLFVKQMMKKIDNIAIDEKTRTSLVDQLISTTGQKMLKEERIGELRLKYGPDLAEWAYEQLQKRPIAKAEVLRRTTIDYKKCKDVDPLNTWHKSNKDDRTGVLRRIDFFAKQMAQMVKFSLLIHPGHLRCHLSTFVDEFNELEDLFDCVGLDEEEVSQKGFDANHLLKARNSKLECVDMSRVILRLPGYLTDANQTPIRRRTPADIFGEMDCLSFAERNNYGTGDFIHANYVIGGPLMNKFVCTQAPMKNTIADFWRMVWQEKPEYIFMLCDVADGTNAEALELEETNRCPIYWPKLLGEQLQFGSLIVRNDNINGIVDPLFNVTELAIFHEDHPENILYVQHWQWDWRDYCDYHWPLRLLRRSRVSKRPTIVHCIDGCGKTGTFVSIEVMLMQLLRGSVNYDYPLLTCASFVRLQRRHAIANHLQYLYIYRVVLHWLEPYITSSYQRFCLGFKFDDYGFVGKYDEMAQNWARKAALR